MLSNLVSKIYKTKWSQINNFEVEINAIGSDAKAKVQKFKIPFKDCKLSIKNFNMPQLSHDAIESFSADTYMRAVGKPNLLTFSFTVRDFDQMKMYRAFSILYAAQKITYPEDSFLTLKVIKKADYINESDITIATFEKCLIDSISQVQFSNETEAQIVEFDVEMTATRYTPAAIC